MMFKGIDIKYYKPKLWKRILGRLGIKKYKVNYVYAIDFATGDDSCVECSGHYDSDGVLNITSFKIIPLEGDKNEN